MITDIELEADLLKPLVKEKENTRINNVVDDNKKEYPEIMLQKDSIEHIKNKNIEEIASIKKDRELKEKYAKWLYGLLVFEIIAIFSVVFIDGFHYKGFAINEWLLGAIFNSIIIQSFLLVRLVTQYLFR